MKALGIVGCGNMGSAIAQGLAERDDIELLGMDVDQDRVEALERCCGLKPVTTLKEMAEKADVILVAVKPGQVKSLLAEICSRLKTSQAIVSVAAGITLAQLKNFSSGVCPVVRVMPNTPAMVQKGVFAVCLDDPVLKEPTKEFVLDLFKPLGRVFPLEERYFDAFTAIAGSGPAYVFYFMEALIEAAVSLGFARPTATAIVQQLVSGSAALTEQSDTHISVLREMVSSPGGTTIAALNVLDNLAVRGSFIEAAKAACSRSEELGK